MALKKDDRVKYVGPNTPHYDNGEEGTFQRDEVANQIVRVIFDAHTGNNLVHATKRRKL